MVFLFWIACFIATLIVATNRNLNIFLYIFLGITLGPFAILIAFLDNSTCDLISSRNVTLTQLRSQLSELKLNIQRTNEKLVNLENYINTLDFNQNAKNKEVIFEAGGLCQKKIDIEKQDSSIISQAYSKSVNEKNQERNNIEVDETFIKKWLSRIGILVFCLGLGFFIHHTFGSFGPQVKIALGYLIGAVLFFMAIKLEKNNFNVNYVKVLYGGAWGTCYFTAFAMYHIESCRVINNQFIVAGVLSFIAVMMIAHALKSKSELMVSITLLIGYLTTTIGEISFFTIFNFVILSMVVIYVVYKFKWTKLLFLSVGITYLLHVFWVVPKVDGLISGQFQVITSEVYSNVILGLMSVFIYWLVFLIGVLLLSFLKNNEIENKLAAINIANTSFFFFIAYPLVSESLFHLRFYFVLILGLIHFGVAIYFYQKKYEKLYLSNSVLAILAFTMSIPINFKHATTTIVWLVEIPVLIYAGLNFKQKLYSLFGFLLFLISIPNIMFFDFMPSYSAIFINFMLKDFVFLLASVSASVSYLLVNSWGHEKSQFNNILSHCLTVGVLFYLICFGYSFVSDQSLHYYFGVLVFLSSFIFYFIKQDRFRYYSYLLLLFLAAKLIFNLAVHYDLYAIENVIIIFDLIVFYSMYMFVKKQKNIDRSELIMLMCGSSFISLIVIFKFVSVNWISLILGIFGCLKILVGSLFEDRGFRIGGVIFIVVCLVRLFLVDLATVDTGYKFISLMMLGSGFLLISFLYNKKYK